MDGLQNNQVFWEYLNKIPYKDALQIQKGAHEKIKHSIPKTGGYLFLLEHYPVITNGRFGNDENFVLPISQIEKLGIEVCKSERGGDLTYHGPGQLVAYPIINLRAFNLGVKAYIASLEQVIINLLIRIRYKFFQKRRLSRSVDKRPKNCFNWRISKKWYYNAWFST